MLSRALSLFNVVHYTVTAWKGMLEFEIRSHNRQHIPGGAYGGEKKFWRAEAQLNTWEGVGMGPGEQKSACLALRRLPFVELALDLRHHFLNPSIVQFGKIGL